MATGRKLGTLVMAVSLAAAVFVSGLAWADDESGAEPTLVRGVSVGGPVAPHRFYGDVRDLPQIEEWQPGDPVNINPRRWYGPEDLGTFTPAERDPLLDIQERAPLRGGTITETENFDGASQGCCPPDPTMDVGPDHIVQSVNATLVRIWDKDDTSTPLASFQMSSLGTGLCASSAGDPIVVYDPIADRWVISEFPQGNALCVYVSMGPNPVTDGWCNYQFDTPGFPDYPKYGVWTDAYWVTTNQGARVYALDRTNMLSCSTARAVQNANAPSLPGLGFQAFTPVDLDGPDLPPAGRNAVMVRHRDTELNGQGPTSPTEDFIEFWEATIDFDTANSLTLTSLFPSASSPGVAVSEFDSNLCPPISFFSCIPQMGGSNLDPLLEVIMYRAAYRNFGTHESVVAVLQTDVGDFEDHSGERWMEFRRSGAGNWTLFQEGTYSPDTVHRFMGAIAQDGDGNILLAYAASDATMFPGARYTGRLATDPLGTMTVPEQVLVNGTSSNPSIRYGDYSQMGVDPEDECTFWFTVEYRGSSQSRIGAVRFNSCGGGPPGTAFQGGIETIDERVRTVALSGFTSPVVVMGPPSFNGAQPTTLRTNAVTAAGFEHYLQEWDYLDGPHTNESIGYLALEAGSGTIGSLAAEAGTVSIDHNWTPVSFGTSFSSPPVVIAQVASLNGGQAVTTRVRSVSASGFEIRLQEEEANNGNHVLETVQWIAVETGTTTVDGNTFIAALTPNSVTHNWFTIGFSSSLSNPVFLAEMQTFDGNNPAALRHRNLTGSSVEVKVEEEASLDEEVSHTTEVVGYLAFSQ